MEELTRSHLCLQLTQPVLVAGVSVDYMACVVVAVMAAFILLKSLSALLLSFPLYALGAVLCKMDAHIFTILHKQLWLFDARNVCWWGCQSYEPF